MSKEAYRLFRCIQQRLEEDREYGELEKRRRAVQGNFDRALEALEPEQRYAVLEMFGISQEMALRELEIAVFLISE